MNIDKIQEERLFQNNSKEDVIRWAKNLRYFHYMRDRGGHNCEGDSFCAYFIFADKEDLTDKLSQIGVKLQKLEEGFIAFDPLKSYSFDDLDKLKITIPQYTDIEQPQYVTLFGRKAHIWIMSDCFEIAVSGTKDRKTYQVSNDDFAVCMLLEKEFDRLGWVNLLDENIKQQSHCISEVVYPELFK
jgi:hypothetical protein